MPGRSETVQPGPWSVPRTSITKFSGSAGELSACTTPPNEVRRSRTAAAAAEAASPGRACAVGLTFAPFKTGAIVFMVSPEIFSSGGWRNGRGAVAGRGNFPATTSTPRRPIREGRNWHRKAPGWYGLGGGGEEENLARPPRFRPKVAVPHKWARSLGRISRVSDWSLRIHRRQAGRGKRLNRVGSPGTSGWHRWRR